MKLRKFYCVDHGYLCEAPSRATVICGQPGPKGRRCNKRAVDHGTYTKQDTGGQ